MKYKLSDIEKLNINFPPSWLVFLYWDLWSWKTTLIQNILKNTFQITDSITSPTYTYYNKYTESLYHFDLYRLEKYDEFFAIWWEEILDWETLCFIEWPNILEKYYKADVIIRIEKTDKEDERIIDITYKD